MGKDIDSAIVGTVDSELFGASTDSLVPNWINKEFLEKHLQTYFSGRKIKIVNYEVKPATAEGENYSSYLHRVKVDYIDELQDCRNTNNSVRGIKIMYNQYLNNVYYSMKF